MTELENNDGCIIYYEKEEPDQMKSFCEPVWAKRIRKLLLYQEYITFCLKRELSVKAC